MSRRARCRLTPEAATDVPWRLCMKCRSTRYVAGVNQTRSGAIGSKPLSTAAASAFPCSYPTIGTPANKSPTAAARSRHAEAGVAAVVKTFDTPTVAPVRLMIAPVVTACSSRTARTRTRETISGHDLTTASGRGRCPLRTRWQTPVPRRRRRQNVDAARCCSTPEAAVRAMPARLPLRCLLFRRSWRH